MLAGVGSAAATRGCPLAAASMASRRPSTMRMLLTVSSASAAPWSQSTSAREHWKAVLLMMPVGMVASTNKSR